LLFFNIIINKKNFIHCAPMFNGFYSDPYSRESAEDDEIYVKNGQFYDNETRSTVPTKKDTTQYDDLPESLQQPINAGCMCNGSKLINEPQHRDPDKCRSNGARSAMTNQSRPYDRDGNAESSKITLNISLTMMEIIEILLLVMIAVLIAIAIRTRSRVLIFAAPHQQTTNNPAATTQ